MAEWTEPKTNYTAGSQVTPGIFNGINENQKYLNETRITTEQVQNAVITSAESASRTNIAANENVKSAFGKIRKWFGDLCALAFKSKVDNDDINSVSAGKVTGLHSVATSGIYGDLSGRPNLHSVAMSGNYKELNNKPEISKSAIGLGNVANERQYSASNPPPYPVTSVNGKTGAVQIEVGGNGLSFRKLKGSDSKYNAFPLSSNATYTITAPTNANNLIVVQGMLTCANKYWVTLFLRKKNPWDYATDTPALYWFRSVNGQTNISYGFISLEASLSGNTLYISGWKINQSDNTYGKSHTRADKCYFALDTVYEILNSSL